MLKSGNWKMRLAAAVCLALGFCVLAWLYMDRQKYRENSGLERAPLTKPRPRTPSDPGKREVRTKNPREEFEKSRKRGLSKEEVRGIAERAVAEEIGVDEDMANTVEDYFELRKRRIEWYVEILTEGFYLTERQLSEVRTRIDKLESEFRILVLNHLIEINSPGRSQMSSGMGLQIPGDSKRATLWHLSRSYSATQLCDLSEHQMKATWPVSEDGQPEREENPPWGPIFTRDFGTQDHYSFLKEPFIENTGGIALFYRAGIIFPLSMKQVDGICEAMRRGRQDSPGETEIPALLPQVKFLTEPQLKTLLLFERQLAVKILTELGD